MISPRRAWMVRNAYASRTSCSIFPDSLKAGITMLRSSSFEMEPLSALGIGRNFIAYVQIDGPRIEHIGDNSTSFELGAVFQTRHPVTLHKVGELISVTRAVEHKESASTCSYDL